MAYQFIHVEAYGRAGAHLKNSTTRKASMLAIRDEMVRAPHACSHVINPQPPNVIFGLHPTAAFDLAAARAERAVDKIGRRLRPEALVVLVGAASWPVLAAEVQHNDEARDHYLRWRDETIAWLRSQWGDLLASVVEHLDEPYPHLHFVVVPKPDPDNRLRIASVHAGYSAAAKCEHAGGKPHERKAAYKEAMKAFQDCYHAQVAVRFGLTRIGPRLQRLTRDEWKERKRQAEISAREHARLNEQLSMIKKKAREFVTEKIAAANAAAQLKIDGIVSESHHEIVRLKKEANRRLTSLRDREAQLQKKLEEKMTLLAAREKFLAHALERLSIYEGSLNRNPCGK